jgi:DNA-binding NtrC family response regulator
MIKIICVDKGVSLYSQLTSVFPEPSTKIYLERTIDMVIERFEAEAFDILVLSSSAAKGGTAIDGIELLEIIVEKCPVTQIIFLAFPKEIRLAISALRAGTYHYAKLPIGDDELRLLIETALERRPSYGPNLLLKKELRETTFEQMVGGSTAIRAVYRQVRQAASTDIPVLLTGETGTGKDLVAQAIHQLSARNEKHFLPVHLASLPGDLVPSELFGHEKGAFTGAMTRFAGCFEQAAGSTIFLDEIGTIDDRIQVSLLRLLETRTFHRIGGTTPIEADFRLIAATNENLTEAVRQGSFREDLFYRLEVFMISLPPVRERHGDIPLLVSHFLKRFNAAYNKTIAGISPECIGAMESYPWPGNVREVKNVIHRAVVMCSGSILMPEHLPERIRSGPKESQKITIPVGTSLSDCEKRIIIHTLKFTGGNRRRAAQVLGISRRALYNKLERYGIAGRK